MNQLVREPINGMTHLLGAILSFIGLFAMVIKAASESGSPLTITAVIIFGISMTLLYSASATYHLVVARDTILSFLRRLDHSMIFILIAGTYAPFCLVALNNITGWVIFSIIIAAAVSGVIFKMIWFECPRWLSTGLYLAMGWLIVLVAVPLSQVLAPPGLWLLVLGGLLYTIGGIIYGFKPKFLEFKQMGFHEIFHIFILLGSIAHFLSVYFFVI
jgi:hemolysin III